MQARVQDIISMIESYFPLRLAESWDNPGLQLGSRRQPVNRVLISLDLDLQILDLARQEKVDLIVTHHPLFFRAPQNIDFDQAQGALIQGLIKSNISVYSAHTNVDAGEQGLSQVLAEKLGLEEIKPLDNYRQEQLLKLIVFVPFSHLKAVREAMSQAGAGHIGKYSECSFSTPGKGTFKPGAETRPYIGEQGRLEEVDEYRLEMVLYERELKKVVKALELAHPYEEVAYDVYELKNEYQVFSMGRKGRLKEAIKLKEFCGLVKKVLNLENIRVVGSLEERVEKVAVVSGAGAGFIDIAARQGMDVLISGDIKYHEAKNAQALGLALIDAGHQGTEQIVSSLLCRLLEESSQKQGWKITFLPAYSPQVFSSL
jgi:dinuclear metal center YbgI/SA1388 family protein